jgi:zinc protease
LAVIVDPQRRAGLNQMRIAFPGRAALCAAALLLLAHPARAVDPIPADAKVVADPTVKTGTLSNGLRYAIRRNANPPGALSVRLAMRVGSYEESDAELGFAHFVEHMAFRSTKQAPEGSIDTRFANLGVAFGRDLNAATTLNTTVYRMDVPKGDAAARKTVLEWLRGAADGILFGPQAVELEKGVVLAELHAVDNAMTRMARETQHFQAPELRSMHRDPGGTLASVGAATPGALQAFYDRWYRPENASLVLVGDAPEEELVKAAEAAFGSWAPRGPAGVRAPAPDTVRPRPLDAQTYAESSVANAVSACRTAPRDGPADASLATMRREALSQLWSTILSKRLVAIVARPGSSLLGTAVVVNRDLPDARFACLIAVPTDGKWREALATAQAELRRFAAAAPTQTEIDAVLADLESTAYSGPFTTGVRPTTALADNLAAAETARRVPMLPMEATRVFNLLVAGVTGDDIRKSFEGDWSGTGPILILNHADGASADEVKAAWTAGDQAKPLESYADREVQEWPYWTFGKKGKVASRRKFAAEGFTRLTFRNGVVANLKPTAFDTGRVEMRVRLGHGQRGLKPEEREPVSLGALLVPVGGLGKLDIAQIGETLAHTNWSVNMTSEVTAYQLSSAFLTSELDQQLRVVGAYLTDPGFRTLIDEKLPTALDYVYSSYRTDPGNVAEVAFEEAVFPGRVSLPPREQLAAYRAKDFARLLKPVLTGSPIEVTIVGDFNEKAAARALARTLGALPPRAALAAPSGEGPFRRFPAQLPKAVTGYHMGPADKAAALIVWPLYVATPERRREEFALALLRSVFETRLMHQVRVVMGKVYAPAVANPMLDHGDQGFMAAQLEATPAEIDSLVAAARTLAGELVAGRITQEEVEAARQPLLAANDRALRENAVWANVLAYSVRDPSAFDEVMGYRRTVESLTLDDVKRAAATWLTAEPVVSRALPKP